MSNDAKQDKLLRAAREVIRREMHQYDALATPAKIRYERALSHDDAAPLYPLRSCAHGVLLHQPCEKCERNIDDCRVYETAMLFRVRELLARLA